MNRFPHAVFSSPLPAEPNLRLLTIPSPALKRRADVTVFLPTGHESKEQLRLLILMHGLYGSHWNWWAFGNLPSTAKHMISTGALPPLVIAMPSDGLWGEGSAYLARHQEDAERWIMEDLPECLSNLIPNLSLEKIFLAGVSMGGYGALRMGCKYSRRVAGISVHSTVTKIEQLIELAGEDIVDSVSASPQELDILSWMRLHRECLPPIRFDCGKEDSFLLANREFHTRLEIEGIPHTYQEFPGAHDWDYWQIHAKDTLNFISQILCNSR